MTTQGFRVDPDKLAEVAKQVKFLLDDISGTSGAVSGNIPDFQKADGHELQEGLAAIWPDWENGFSTGYGYEHTGMMTAYNSIKDQLSALYSACQQTATQYGDQDKNSKRAVSAVDGEV